jgi:hypothetical protein
LRRSPSKFPLILAGSAEKARNSKIALDKGEVSGIDRAINGPLYFINKI